MHKFLKRGHPGFTLIELLIVIVIIGILSVAFLPTVLNGPRKARDSRRITDVNAIVQAVQSFNLESSTGAYPAAITDLAKYFTNSLAPTDPGTNGAYHFFRDTTNQCILVGATLESAEKANSATAPVLTGATPTPACHTALTKGAPTDTTAYYYQMLKY